MVNISSFFMCNHKSLPITPKNDYYGNMFIIKLVINYMNSLSELMLSQNMIISVTTVMTNDIQ